MGTACVVVPSGGGDDDGNHPAAAAAGPTVVEIHPADIWGQPLPTERTVFEVRADGQLLHATAAPARIELDAPTELIVTLSHPDHFDLRAELTFDGTAEHDALSARVDGRHGMAQSRSQQDGTTHRVYLGLEHAWFSSGGRPARRGHELALFRSGEDTWAAVHGDLQRAEHEIMASTWWWDSDFELVRHLGTHHVEAATGRWPNTILAMLEASPATKRVLVGQWLKQDFSLASWVTTDDMLDSHALDASDNFEVMGQANATHGEFWFEPSSFVFTDRIRQGRDSEAFALMPTIASNVPSRQVNLTAWPIDLDVAHASYHQKFFVIDDVAYVGGMNLRGVDWDTTEHRIFDHRRMAFDATSEERAAVMDKEAEPDFGPRKDYFVRIDGPAVQDVADVFKARWDHQLAAGVEGSFTSTSFEIARDQNSHAGGSMVQITTTLPEPFWEHSIAETWFKAIDNAEEFILIEDQYFRAPMLNERIVERMEQVPNLRLVVVTKPVSTLDPGCAWTAQAHTSFAAKFPKRYLPLQLRTFDTVVTWGWDETDGHFANIDTHSKMLIVDDQFMSVGSANKNNRGMVYEAEMNVAVHDPAWVRDERRKILEGMLLGDVGDDAGEWFAMLDKAAAHNRAVETAWDDEGGDIDLDGAPLPQAYAPRGFVYPLEQPTLGACVFESVGPDMTSGI